MRLNVYGSNRRLLLANYVIDFSSPTPYIPFSMAPGEHIYGFGDKRGPQDKHGQLLDMWNRGARFTDSGRAIKAVARADTARRHN